MRIVVPLLLLAACGPVATDPPPVVAVAAPEAPDPLPAEPEPAPKPAQRSDGPAAIGEVAPAIAATYVTGQGPRDLDAALGHVTVVFFWATFSSPAMHAFAALQRVMDARPGMAVLAVAVDDPEDTDEATLRAFAQRAGARFVVVWDKDRAAASAWSPTTMPTGYVLDAEGVVRHIHAGYSDDTGTDIERQVLALMQP